MKLEKINSIEIKSNTQGLQFSKDQTGIWQINSNANFPAQANLVNELLSGVAYLKIIEKKTKDPSLYSLLNVNDLNNKKSNAILLSFKDTDKGVVANLLVGKQSRAGPAGTKQKQVYVRKQGEKQSYLVEGALPISLEFKDWVNQPLLPILADDINKIIINNNPNKLAVILYKDKEQVVFHIKENKTNKKNKSINKKIVIESDNAFIYGIRNLEYHNAFLYKNFFARWRPTSKIDIEMKHNFSFRIEFAKLRKQVYARIFVKIIDKEKNIPDSHTLLFDKISKYSELLVFQIPDEIYNIINRPRNEMFESLK